MELETVGTLQSNHSNQQEQHQKPHTLSSARNSKTILGSGKVTFTEPVMAKNWTGVAKTCFIKH